jgi:hypothetical protein
MDKNFRHLLVTLASSIGLTIVLLCLLPGSMIRVSGALRLPERPEAGDVPRRYIYLPLVNNKSANLHVNPQDRQDARAFYINVYLGSEGIPIEWNGSHNICNPGTTADDFRNAVLRRVNYFREMAGVPADVVFADEYNKKAQQAALMMSCNDRLSHDPDDTWVCYTADGDVAAQRSNLFFGYNGWKAVEGYIKEPGSNNYAVGHRRWVLYPQTKFMGTGDVPAAGGHEAANALWIFDDNLFGQRPDTRYEFVAWPPPGYVPYQVVFPRWSFAYAEADFSSASVSMKTGGTHYTVYIQPIVNGYGENTLVWEPVLNIDRPPADDRFFRVSVTNVFINGSPRDFTYDVTVFDPGVENSDLVEDTWDGQLGAPLKFP